MALTIVQNTALSAAATASRTSSICEPTTASNGAQLMVTGNWFASSSINAGASWAHVDPYTRFPTAAAGFCCDQVVVFNPRYQIWIWLLQYSQIPGGSNLFRVAVCRATQFGQWRYWDFRPTDLNPSWTTLWYDYPDMAFTNDHLHISFNSFIEKYWQRAFVFRLPLAALAAGGALSYRWYSTTSNGSIRLCRGPGAVMHMGSHDTLAQLRLFSWADSSTSVVSSAVGVRLWADGVYSAPGPGAVEWLTRADSRITGAWVGNGVIGLMWTANRDAAHPLPFIRVARITESTRALLDQPDIWSRSSAWAYPSAAANSQGEVGISAFFGGGTRHPAHAVGIKTATSWSTQLTRTSSHGPVNGAWGDYLSTSAHHVVGNQWVASGYTLQGGGGRVQIEPRHVRFHP